MKNIFYWSLILLVAGCKEKFEATVNSPLTGYLVIEGVVNSGQGNTTLQLSRTTQLDNRFVQYEKGANVKVEGNDNSVYILAEKAQGQYSADRLNLNSNVQYRLRVKTSAGKEYLSDYASVIVNPPIDSITWKRENQGVRLYIETHNPLNNTRYYQWDYSETWEIHSAYISSLKYKITNVAQGRDEYSVVYRDSSTFSFDPKIDTCWQSAASRDLLLGSSAKLIKDVIYLPIAYVPPGSRKLSILYSINVKQYAWSKKGYEFLEKIKKNSQDIGSIFDAQPSELKGNIRCLSDTTEPVIGYFNISNVEEKRIFIKVQDVGGWNYTSDCFLLEIENQSDSILKKGGAYYPTIPVLILMNGNIATFNMAPPDCVDCTLIGTNIKPPFWP